MALATLDNPPSSQPDLGILERLHAAQSVCIALAGFIAALVLCAWLVPALGALLPSGWSLMKANTALAFLLASGSLFLTQPGRGARRLLAGRLCALLVVFIAGSALVEFLSGLSLGLDTLLAADRTSALPGRMSAQTATFLVLLGFILVFEGAWRKSNARTVELLTIGLVAWIFMLMAGYLFGAAYLLGQSPTTVTSPQTLLCMILATIAVVIRRSASGFLSVLVGVGIGSHTARVTLPFAVLLPFVAAMSGAVVAEAGWLSIPYAAGIAAALLSVVFFVFVVLVARQINDLERALRDMSLTDELTRVYNRRGFLLLGEHALHLARRRSAPLTVKFFDVDGLKVVNDSLGHDMGSQLLVDMAGLLQATFRSSDVVARVGGDEFAVVLHNLESELAPAMQRLADATARMNQQSGRKYQLSYSVGGAADNGTAGESFAQLVDRADAIMYQAKRLKKGSRAAAQPVPA